VYEFTHLTIFICCFVYRIFVVHSSVHIINDDDDDDDL